MQKSPARLRQEQVAPNELVANLLEASWSARRTETNWDGTDRTLIQLMLCCADIVTLHDVVAADLDRIASCSGYTQRHLERLFKQALGESPSGWFAKVRLYGAWHELRRPGASASDVARRWGFPHVGRFSAYYRAAYGESPREVLKLRG